MPSMDQHSEISTASVNAAFETVQLVSKTIFDTINRFESVSTFTLILHTYATLLYFGLTYVHTHKDTYVCIYKNYR